MRSLAERLGLEVPVVQAALGGAASNAGLAAAVMQAGGLGSVGMLAPKSMLAELKRARGLAPRDALAAGLLLPFTRRAHVDAVIEARPDAVILLDGFAPRAVRRMRDAGIYLLHQIGARPPRARRCSTGRML